MRRELKIYDVFARQRRREPLAHVGTVTAPNADLAAAYARSIYNEEPWIEMRVVAQQDEITVIELEESFA